MWSPEQKISQKNIPLGLSLEFAVREFGGKGAEVSYLDDFHIYSSPVYTEVLEFALIHNVA